MKLVLLLIFFGLSVAYAEERTNDNTVRPNSQGEMAAESSNESMADHDNAAAQVQDLNPCLWVDDSESGESSHLTVSTEHESSAIAYSPTQEEDKEVGTGADRESTQPPVRSSRGTNCFNH